MSAKSTQLPGQKQDQQLLQQQQIPQQQQPLTQQQQQFEANQKMLAEKFSSSKYTSSSVEDGHNHFRTFTYSAQLKQATAGAVAAAITRTITQPLDVLKIRFQLQVEPVKSSGSTAKSKYTSISQAVRVIYHEEGVRAFWKGHNAGQLMNIVYGIAQFWSYEQVNLLTKQMPWLSEHTHARHFISGSVAGCCSAVVSMPFDVIRTRLVAQDPNCVGGYRTISGAFPTIWRAEGIRGLFRGLASTVLQLGPLMGANFMFYKIFNDYARDILKPSDNLLPTWCLLVTGGAAGVASKAGVYPLDFIKKRLQVQGFENQRKTFGRNQRCTGILHCIELTLKEEGLTGFYKGMVPTLLKSGLTTAFYFSIYDKFKKMEGI